MMTMSELDQSIPSSMGDSLYEGWQGSSTPESSVACPSLAIDDTGALLAMTRSASAAAMELLGEENALPIMMAYEDGGGGVGEVQNNYMQGGVAADLPQDDDRPRGGGGSFRSSSKNRQDNNNNNNNVPWWQFNRRASSASMMNQRRSGSGEVEPLPSYGSFFEKETHQHQQQQQPQPRRPQQQEDSAKNQQFYDDDDFAPPGELLNQFGSVEYDPDGGQFHTQAQRRRSSSLGSERTLDEDLDERGTNSSSNKNNKNEKNNNSNVPWWHFNRRASAPDPPSSSRDLSRKGSALSSQKSMESYSSVGDGVDQEELTVNNEIKPQQQQPQSGSSDPGKADEADGSKLDNDGNREPEKPAERPTNIPWWQRSNSNRRASAPDQQQPTSTDRSNLQKIAAAAQNNSSQLRRKSSAYSSMEGYSSLEEGGVVDQQELKSLRKDDGRGQSASFSSKERDQNHNPWWRFGGNNNNNKEVTNNDVHRTVDKNLPEDNAAQTSDNNNCDRRIDDDPVNNKTKGSQQKRHELQIDFDSNSLHTLDNPGDTCSTTPSPPGEDHVERSWWSFPSTDDDDNDDKDHGGNEMLDASQVSNARSEPFYLFTEQERMQEQLRQIKEQRRKSLTSMVNETGDHIGDIALQKMPGSCPSSPFHLTKKGSDSSVGKGNPDTPVSCRRRRRSSASDHQNSDSNHKLLEVSDKSSKSSLPSSQFYNISEPNDPHCIWSCSGKESTSREGGMMMSSHSHRSISRSSADRVGISSHSNKRSSVHKKEGHMNKYNTNDNIESLQTGEPRDTMGGPESKNSKSGTPHQSTISGNTHDVPFDGGSDDFASVWDSSKLCEIKEGVSLSKVQVFDEVSSIASSEHSGRVPLRRVLGRRSRSVTGRSLFGFGWNKSATDIMVDPSDLSEEVQSKEQVELDISSRQAELDVSSKQGSREALSANDASSKNNTNHSWHRRKGLSKSSHGLSKSSRHGLSKSSHGLSKSTHGVRSFAVSIIRNKRHSDSSSQQDSSSCDNTGIYDDGGFDDEEYYYENEVFGFGDAKRKAVVRDACELMNNVNKSTVAMGMEAPFRPVDEMFPPLKKLHSNIGYQMDSLKAAVGNPKSVSRRARKMKKSLKKSSIAMSSSMFNPSAFGNVGSDGPLHSAAPAAPPPQLNDHKALTAYIMDQMMQLQHRQSNMSDNSGISDSEPSHLASMYTSYLPNFLWYQPIAADSSQSSMIRPTSMCSGTGITGDEQYLKPDMLNVFSHFGSYFLGSGHLFQEDDDGDPGGGAAKTKPSRGANNNNKRRAAFWVETIDEEDSMGSDGISNSSYGSMDDDSDSSAAFTEDEDEGGAQMQKAFIEKVIEDLRCSQMMMMEPRVMPDYKIADKK